MDLKSNLSWYGKTPPKVNYLDDTNAPGFTPKRQELSPSEFKGISGEEYTHTGVRQLGTLKFTDWFLNDHAKGFTGNMFPLGGAKKESQFVGISGEAFTYTGLQEIGNLQNNIYDSAEQFKSRFVYNEDDFTVSVSKAKGFNRYGTAVESSIIPISRDSFVIDDMTMSDRGLAKRKAQGGTGYPFPNYGENVYDWKPSAHIGWHPDNKYTDTIKKNKTAGLADTYTEDSPIDDLYNKLNLREDAHQTGYIKHPLILRGIQREGKTDNQRWGLADTTAGQISSTLDLPRGGILTSIERGVIDIARLAKFMVSPPGLAFAIKQVGMQLMNPNVEGVDGKAQKAWHKNSTKAWTPINTLLQPLAGIAGMHIKRHGVLPVDLPGGIPGNYEGVIDNRDNEGVDKSISKNRLVQLGKRYGTGLLTSRDAQGKPIGVGGSEFSTPGAPVKGGILSAKTGPESVGGIGSTILSRHSDTTIKTQLGTGDSAKQSAGGMTFATYTSGQYTYGRPYQNIRDNETTVGLIRQEVDAGDGDIGFDPGPKGNSPDNKKVNLARRAGSPGGGLDSNGYDANKARFGDMHVDSFASEESVMGTDYNDRWGESKLFHPTRLNNYKAIRAITKDRTPHSSGILDFRSLKLDTTNPKIDNYGADDTLNPNKDKTLTARGYPNFLPTVAADGTIAPRKESPDSYWSDPKEPGLIKFYFNPVDPTKGPGGQGNIGFRAYIDSLDDAFTPEWASTRDQGRADSLIQYTGFARTISVSFKVPITSKAESKEVWRRLNSLARITLPNYGGTAGYTGQFVRVTIGDLYNSVPMYINDLTYSWDSETPWEITSGEQVPFYTSVDMSLGWVGNSAPSKDQKVYNYG